MISIVAITKNPSYVTVAIGGYYWNFETKPNTPVSYFELPFDGQITGPVRLTLNGRTVEGPPIVNECWHGHVGLISRPTVQLLTLEGHLQSRFNRCLVRVQIMEQSLWTVVGTVGLLQQARRD